MAKIRSILTGEEIDMPDVAGELTPDAMSAMSQYVAMVTDKAKKEARAELSTELEAAKVAAVKASAERDTAKSLQATAEKACAEMQRRIDSLQAELAAARRTMDGHVSALMETQRQHVEATKTLSSAADAKLQAEVKRLQEMAKKPPAPTAQKPKELKLDFVRDQTGAMKSPITVKLVY